MCDCFIICLNLYKILWWSDCRLIWIDIGFVFRCGQIGLHLYEHCNNNVMFYHNFWIKIYDATINRSIWKVFMWVFRKIFFTTVLKENMNYFTALPNLFVQLGIENKCFNETIHFEMGKSIRVSQFAIESKVTRPLVSHQVWPDSINCALVAYKGALTHRCASGTWLSTHTIGSRDLVLMMMMETVKHEVKVFRRFLFWSNALFTMDI